MNCIDCFVFVFVMGFVCIGCDLIFVMLMSRSEKYVNVLKRVFGFFFNDIVMDVLYGIFVCIVGIGFCDNVKKCVMLDLLF